MPAEPNDQLRATRERTPSLMNPGTGMSRSELAERLALFMFEHYGRSVPVDRKYIAKLEAGRIRWPKAEYREGLRSILNVDLDSELGFRSTLNTTREHVPLLTPAGAGLQLPWTTAGAVSGATLMAEVTNLNRRKFVQMSGATLLGLGLEALCAPGAYAERRRGRVTVTHADVDALASVGGQLRKMDDTLGGAPVLAIAQAHLREATRLLSEGRYGSDVGQALHALTAEAERFCGWLSWEVQEPGMAGAYWEAGLHSAQVAGDRQISANVLCYMAAMALETEQYEEARQLACAARMKLIGTPKIAALAAISHAEASAAAGAELDARRSIEDAFTSLGQSDESGPEWAYWLDEAHVHEQAGRALLWLGDHEAAIDHLSAFVAGTSPGREQARGLNYLARALAADGEPDEACSVAAGTVALLNGTVNSPRSVHGLCRVRDALAPYDTAAVVEFREAVRAVAA